VIPRGKMNKPPGREKGYVRLKDAREELNAMLQS
jgi:hypothetical protein